MEALREASYDVSPLRPGMASGSAYCVICRSRLGDVTVLEGPCFGLWLGPGYVSIGDRRGLPAYGRRNRNHLHHKRGFVRRGEPLKFSGGTRGRLTLGSARAPVIDQPALIYCLNCGLGQRVARPPVSIEPDPTMPSSADLEWEVPISED